MLSKKSKNASPLGLVHKVQALRGATHVLVELTLDSTLVTHASESTGSIFIGQLVSAKGSGWQWTIIPSSTFVPSVIIPLNTYVPSLKIKLFFKVAFEERCLYVLSLLKVTLSRFVYYHFVSSRMTM